MIKKKRRFILVLAILLTSFFYSTNTFADTSESKESSSVKSVQSLKDSYTIGTDVTFAPFEFSQTDGKYVGIDIDILNHVASLNNFNITIEPVGFNAAVQAVEAGQMDGMIAGMTITEDRKKVFDFSDPYFQSGIQMAIKEGNESIHSYDDLKGKTVGAKTGTESGTFVEANKDKYGYTVKLYDTSDVLYDVLDSGNIDAIFDDYPVVGYAVAQGKPITTVTDYEKGGEYGFAVKKGTNPELLEMFNAGLAELKQTGEYQTILDTYIKSPEKASNEDTIPGIVENNYKSLLNGLWRTLYLTIISIAIGLVIGILFGMMSVAKTKLPRFISTVYVDIIRGIPLYVLALFIYLGIPNVTGMKLDSNVAGIITLSLNASAYIAEIVRGGINAVPIGQTEAAMSLGLPYRKTMVKIILPQAIKIMIPSFINQFVITLKDTTILSAIGLLELLKVGQIIVARNLQSFRVYLIISVMYIIVITLLTKLSKIIERRIQANG